MKPRHFIVIGIFAAANLIIFYQLFGDKGQNHDQKKKKDFLAHLEAKKVENSEEQFNVVGYGTVSSYNSVDVSCEVQGKMEAGVQLKPGVKFKKGQLLFKVNDNEARYSIRSRKSGFINLIANLLPDIKVDFSSEFEKWNQYIESIKLNESLPTLPAWKSDKEKIFLSTRNVLSEYFSIKSQEEQLKKFYVHAPFSGTITDVYVNDFSVINPGTKVIRIVQTGNYEIPVSIPASHLDLVDIGTEGKIFTTEGREKGTGKVVRISEVINRNTQSIDVYVKPTPYEGQAFIEGEYVSVRINEIGKFEGVRIPKSALAGNEVFVYSSRDSLLAKRQVTVLDENEYGVFISGLKDNDIVITQEVINYKDSVKFGIILK